MRDFPARPEGPDPSLEKIPAYFRTRFPDPEQYQEEVDAWTADRDQRAQQWQEEWLAHEEWREEQEQEEQDAALAELKKKRPKMIEMADEGRVSIEDTGHVAPEVLRKLADPANNVELDYFVPRTMQRAKDDIRAAGQTTSFMFTPGDDGSMQLRDTRDVLTPSKLRKDRALPWSDISAALPTWFTFIARAGWTAKTISSWKSFVASIRDSQKIWTLDEKLAPLVAARLFANVKRHWHEEYSQGRNIPLGNVDEERFRATKEAILDERRMEQIMLMDQKVRRQSLYT
jgi:hypothetical protein